MGLKIEEVNKLKEEGRVEFSKYKLVGSKLIKLLKDKKEFLTKSEILNELKVSNPLISYYLRNKKIIRIYVDGKPYYGLKEWLKA